MNHKFKTLKRLKPQFSARYFAQRAGIQSPSYFNLVVKGKRNLSVDFAYRFAAGLDLNDLETDCLVTAVELETTDNSLRKRHLQDRLVMLRKADSSVEQMPADHVEILSDLINLKIYLLAQSTQFKFHVDWIHREFGGEVDKEEIRRRMEVLLQSGLWLWDGSEVKARAPSIKTGSYLHNKWLAQTHRHLLEAATESLHSPAETRIHGGRTFLCDPKRMSEIERRFEKFRRDIEHEFEDLNSTKAFQLQMSFFEIKPGGSR